MAKQTPTLFDDFFGEAPKKESPQKATHTEKTPSPTEQNPSNASEKATPNSEENKTESKQVAPTEQNPSNTSEKVTPNLKENKTEFKQVAPTEQDPLNTSEKATPSSEENKTESKQVAPTEITERKKEQRTTTLTEENKSPAFTFEKIDTPSKKAADPTIQTNRAASSKQTTTDKETLNQQFNAEVNYIDCINTETAQNKNSTDSDPLSISFPHWELPKKYYGIGAVAQLFKVNVSHIRFWTNEFKIKTRTNKKGDRLYTPQQIHTLRIIHHLVKIQKHTIKGAKEKLKHTKTAVIAQLSLKDYLSELKGKLEELRDHL